MDGDGSITVTLGDDYMRFFLIVITSLIILSGCVQKVDVSVVEKVEKKETQNKDSSIFHQKEVNIRENKKQIQAYITKKQEVKWSVSVDKEVYDFDAFYAKYYEEENEMNENLHEEGTNIFQDLNVRFEDESIVELLGGFYKYEATLIKSGFNTETEDVVEKILSIRVIFKVHYDEIKVYNESIQ